MKESRERLWTISRAREREACALYNRGSFQIGYISCGNERDLRHSRESGERNASIDRQLFSLLSKRVSGPHVSRGLGRRVCLVARLGGVLILLEEVLRGRVAQGRQRQLLLRRRRARRHRRELVRFWGKRMRESERRLVWEKRPALVPLIKTGKRRLFESFGDGGRSRLSRTILDALFRHLFLAPRCAIFTDFVSRAHNLVASARRRTRSLSSSSSERETLFIFSAPARESAQTRALLNFKNSSDSFFLASASRAAPFGALPAHTRRGVASRTGKPSSERERDVYLFER